MAAAAAAAPPPQHPRAPGTRNLGLWSKAKFLLVAEVWEPSKVDLRVECILLKLRKWKTLQVDHFGWNELKLLKDHRDGSRHGHYRIGKMLGQILVTKQTGPQGKIVSKVYLCEKLSLVNEMYFAITLDRSSAGPIIIACRKGGTSIEDLAEKLPDMIVKVPIDVFKGITDEDAANVVDGRAPKVVAAKADLNYIGLDGEIGCMVNGAGLAMATMDIIKLHGGTPANFLDVGGNASENQVSLKVPVVVRLEGTNVDQGKRILKESGMTLIAAEDLDAAAEKAVKASRVEQSKFIHTFNFFLLFFVMIKKKETIACSPCYKESLNCIFWR
ncbi:uncharacterized protein A4U43_C10F19330 [Asparagus officinalis]|uniref:Uncharacterized protein n=1 Tax=Asparagus officinalis TaxID=4686 RepID=A0A5P1E411_ASPOF|nr:uncharacterized protein A4U43_C10F19330 [Asparagus officinalis]